MRPEELFIETPMPKGCVTCKKLHLKCDERKPACKRCTAIGRTCEGYVCVSTKRKPTDVTPESILEFRQRCLPSREHPKKALAVPVVHLEAPNVIHSFATITSNGLAAQEDFMLHIIRAVFAHSHKGGKEEERKRKRQERENSVIKFHEPIKDIFDLSKPEGCPVIQSAFMLQMYHVLMDIMMSKGTNKAAHDLLMANSKGRKK